MEPGKYKKDDTSVALYSVFKGEIASVKEYGIFVRVPQSKKQGLVHKSQMSSTKIENPEEMVSVGETVWCKVISVDADGGKIGLSMKVVNQTIGKDLDPNHIQASLDEQRRKTGHKQDRQKIELGAVYDTTCTKCKGKGHIARDCFHIPGAKSYELLPDVDDLPSQQVPQHTEKHDKHKKPKKEKDKKKRKHQHRDSSSDSDSEPQQKKHKKKSKRKTSHRNESDSEESGTPKKKKKKKEKKKKSKHHDSSS